MANAKGAAFIAAPAAAPPPNSAEQPRARFYVELKPGETTVVSWTRLVRDHSKLSTDNDESTGMPGNEAKAPVPPQSRFSSVIEKIESLYTGQLSSDEEEHDVPDGDQYDTEDSFIDDAELDEYFKVDKLVTKHEGYFVNKGKLEHFERSSLPKEMPRKLKRKELTKYQGDGFGLAHNDGVNFRNACLNAADGHVQAPRVEFYNQSNLFRSKGNTFSLPEADVLNLQFDQKIQ